MTPGSFRYFAWLYSTPAQRAVLQPLFAIETEILESTRLDHNVAHLRLEWWHGEFERLGQKQATHPLAIELVKACEAAGTSLPDLRELVRLAYFDLAAATFADEGEWSEQLARWAQSVGASIFAICTTSLPVRSAALQILCALREFELLAAARTLAQLGRIVIPQQVLRQSGVPYDALRAATWSASVTQLWCQRVAALCTRLRSAVSTLPREQRRALRPLLVWAALTARRAAALMDPASKTFIANQIDAAAQPLPLDAFFGWRTARAVQRGHLPRILELS